MNYTIEQYISMLNETKSYSGWIKKNDEHGQDRIVLDIFKTLPYGEEIHIMHTLHWNDGHVIGYVFWRLDGMSGYGRHSLGVWPADGIDTPESYLLALMTAQDLIVSCLENGLYVGKQGMVEA